MAWLELTLDCDRDAAERLGDLLTEAGALSVSLSNACEEILIEQQPDAAPLWSATRVQGLFDHQADPERIAQALKTAGFGEPEVKRIEDEEWAGAWKQHVHPQRYGDRLWVLPSFAEAPAGDAVCVRLDPGLAFGTGGHATTALCLEWLAGLRLDGKEVIDYGCGSGVLAIAALKLGAARARCVDNDPCALDTARANARANGVEKQLSFFLPEDLPRRPADLVVANILAGPLIQLAATLTALVADGGRIALCGILSEQVKAVTEAYTGYIAYDAPETREGWVRLSGIRAAASDPDPYPAV